MDKSEIGNTGTPVTMHIERGKIREFAKAIKDDNPIYFDEAHAKKVAGGIVPPPTFTMTSGFWDDGPRKPLLTYDVRRLLHGEQEFEYLAPVHAGDVLTGTTRVSDVYEKQGSRGGTMTFGTIETTYTNQHGEEVMISRSTLVETAAPVKKEG
ncbi:MAG TPA: MaoC family dehydratase N-terminal domain-containing protein [Candidatus Acidoferrales bacterium]|nr:MaoC family dehydratase N-terminal domain-containing protein [Candidatus Acidoferrales bacterium]